MFNVIIIVIIKSFKVRNVRLHVISVSKKGILMPKEPKVFKHVTLPLKGT